MHRQGFVEIICFIVYQHSHVLVLNISLVLRQTIILG